ncbi:transporter [Chelatococcus reniformis]|uniref:Magnesium transporter CorA n=1 Tax=Chelatococcus reniformis TaxID=1494448 RepID=A0A916UNA8_9HYPH|nr:transporter [Chelatococcus reniformis]GGC79037.1 magnesium transporter CorA [Chelatococcus reniformis]
MIALTDHTGLICGFAIYPSGTQAVAWGEMDKALASRSGVVWLHFNLTDARAREWVDACEHLPRRARDVLLADDRHVRIDPVGEGIAGVVGDLHHDLHTEADEVGLLHFYVDDHCVISARRLPLKAVDQLRHAVADGMKVRRPIDLIIALFHYIASALDGAMDRLGEQLDDVEDPILTGQIADKSAELGRCRRLTARIRRHLLPQKHALMALVTRLPEWVEEPEAGRLRKAVERLEALSHDLDLIQERARLLQDELSSRLAEETNRNLYVLSIVTVIFLPMTLVSGIFGMNLGGMPGLQSDAGFWWGMALIAVVAVVTTMVLRRMRLV